MTLWHYTCDHTRAALGDSGRLISALAQIDAAKTADWPKWKRTISGLIWLTDLDVPIRDALGLTMNTIGCDRTRHRYRVVNYTAIRYSVARRDLPKRLRDELESAPGAMPMHWWFAWTPVPVVYDPATTRDHEGATTR